MIVDPSGDVERRVQMDEGGMDKGELDVDATIPRLRATASSTVRTSAAEM